MALQKYLFQFLHKSFVKDPALPFLLRQTNALHQVLQSLLYHQAVPGRMYFISVLSLSFSLMNKFPSLLIEVQKQYFIRI